MSKILFTERNRIMMHSTAKGHLRVNDVIEFGKTNLKIDEDIMANLSVGLLNYIPEVEKMLVSGGAFYSFAQSVWTEFDKIPLEGPRIKGVLDSARKEGLFYKSRQRGQNHNGLPLMIHQPMRIEQLGLSDKNSSVRVIDDNGNSLYAVNPDCLEYFGLHFLRNKEDGLYLAFVSPQVVARAVFTDIINPLPYVLDYNI